MNIEKLLKTLILPSILVVGSACGSDKGRSSSNSCGDSPLYGKYLWQVGECEVGSEKPFDKNCKGDISGDVGGTGHIVVDYYGLTLTSEKGSFDLVRDFSCSGVGNGNKYDKHYKNCSQLLCLVQESSALYVQMPNDFNTNDGIWYLTNSPWPGRDLCYEHVKSKGWYTSCPYP